MDNQSINYITRDMNFFALNPCTCGRQSCLPSHSYGPAARSYWLLHFVVKGKGIFNTKRKMSEVSAGMMFVIKPFEVTYYIADINDPWEYIWMGFYTDNALPSMLNSSDTITCSELKSTFEQAVKPPFSLESGNGYEQFLCAKIWEVLAYISKISTNNVLPTQKYVDNAKRIFETEYVNNISVAYVAKRLHLHRTYFSMIFKKNVGISPMEYLMQIRMKKALELLSEHKCSVSVTAASVGYVDVFVFSRAFKKYYKKAPDIIKKT